MKKLLEKLFSWFPLYRSAVGGYGYYTRIRGRRYLPHQFRSCGEGVEIGYDVVIANPERMKIGDGVKIYEECHIRASGGLQIGSYSGFGRCTTIITTDHIPESESLPFGNVSVVKPVIIEDNVWVGSNVAILGGVTIGEGSIIGLGSVVRRDVPACAIVVGNPARVIGYRDKEHYAELKRNRAVRPPSASMGGLVITSSMKQKYQELIDEIGLDCETIDDVSAST